MEIGHTIAANPGPQLGMIKSLLRQNGVETDSTVVQDREWACLQAARKSPEHKEAVDAFVNKRAPNFRQFAEAES